MLHRFLVVVSLALAALGAGCARDATPTDAGTASAYMFPQPGSRQLLPEALLPRLDGEGVLDTASLRGTPVVLNFWATWCAFCVEEMPALESVHRALGDDVRFVGIDREDNLDKAQTLAEETGVSYELVVDEDGSFFRAVEARGMPTTVLVTADGSITYRHAGPLTAEELQRLVAEHLDVPTADRPLQNQRSEVGFAATAAFVGPSERLVVSSSPGRARTRAVELVRRVLPCPPGRFAGTLRLR